MSLANRSLVTIDDLSNGEIEAVFSLADQMSGSAKKRLNLCNRFIMASLFYEPSTRTRLSFESAMQRLGGGVISCADMQTSSAAKGESIADTARVVAQYADIIVIRHPWEGAAKVAADYAGVPVINAGDGGHEHPTQTLCDLYTLRKEKGTIKGLTVALWGDLRYGRAIHSLAYGLARFGADIVSVPIEGLEMPTDVADKLRSEYNCHLERTQLDDMPSIMGKVDVIYMNPARAHQLPLFQVEVTSSLRIRGAKEKLEIDVLYLTRIQKERHPQGEKEKAGRSYHPIDFRLLKGPAFKDTLVMHPLPRTDELPYEVDKEPRGVYFKQAAYGVPIRMALTSLLLGAEKANILNQGASPSQKMAYPVYGRNLGVTCSNLNCVSVHEARYIKPEFKIVSKEPLRLRCVYCDRDKYPQYIASSDWHQGILENKKYHSADSYWIRKIRPENLIIFSSENEAKAHGFQPSYYARTHH